MASAIHNPSVELTALPAPLQGALKGGQRIVLSYTPAALEAACPSLNDVFRVTDLGDAYAGATEDASYGILSGGTVAQTFTVNDATVDDVSSALTLSHTTSGTAAANIGVGIQLKAENDGGSAVLAAFVSGVLATATAAAEIGLATIAPAAAGVPVTGFRVRAAASAVNGAEMLPGAIGVAVRFYPYGETNASIRAAGKGTGSFAITNPANSTIYVEVNSTGLGFFGVTPIARPLLATGASATVDNVITVLQNLGLVRQS